jgi:hypothetical protein
MAVRGRRLGWIAPRRPLRPAASRLMGMGLADGAKRLWRLALTGHRLQACCHCGG